MNDIKNKIEEDLDDVTLDLYDSEDDEDDDELYIDEAELRSDSIELKEYYANLL